MSDLIQYDPFRRYAAIDKQIFFQSSATTTEVIVELVALTS